MPRELQRYLSYLVRLWDEGSPTASQWRASIEDPDSDERLGFADLASLFAFLQAQTCADPPSDEMSKYPDEEH